MASFLASQSLRQYNICQQLRFVAVIVCSIQLAACGSSKYISKQADKIILSDSNLIAAHVGISIYDPSTNKYLYNHDADKYFIPASNTKLFTCYAAMKYLGDSLVGLEYQNFSDTAIQILATGDPTFLSDDFKTHPVLDFLKKEKKAIYISPWNWHDDPLGFGWSWDDYSSSDAAEKSIFPIHHNLASVKLDTFTYEKNYINLKWRIKPSYFSHDIPNYFSLSLDVAKKINRDSIELRSKLRKFEIQREIKEDKYSLVSSNTTFKLTEIPFWTDTIKTAVEILKADYGVNNIRIGVLDDNSLYPAIPSHLVWNKIYSQPTDSLLKVMMHRSDNFYAEQCLVMIGTNRLGTFGTRSTEIISSLVNALYKDLPQKPRWVDGCGLSRYNLFSPQDMITVLNKMKTDFNWNRITTILATGGEGTLKNYYHNLKDRIFAKTGTLSNNIALSGFLITSKNKTLVFSVLVNNHMGSETQIRKAVEKFLTSIADKY